MHAQERELASLTHPEPLPLYRYPTASMRLGCSLGNFLLFARTDPESNLMGLWASEDQWYCGRLRISLRTPSGPLLPSATLLRPEAQETEYEGPGVRARKRIWVPAGTAWDRAVVWTLELEGDGQGPARLWVQLDAVWPPIVEQEGLRRAEPEQQEKRVRCRLERGVVVAVTQPLCGRPATEVRLLGIWGGVPEPAAHHFGEPGTTRLVYELTLPPGTPTRLHWVLLTDPGGEAAAWQAWQSMPCPDRLYSDTLGYLTGRLSLPSLLTPSPAVNRGFQWAKVNTLRTQCRYPSGYGFTNDPPQDILVVRDAAWYILGNDWLTPDFSREMIELVLRESVRIVRMDRGLIIAETRHGFVCANAGVDLSNVPPGYAALLPLDPDASAAAIRRELAERANWEPAVIVSDTFGRAWRNGIVNVAIGVAGLRPLEDYRGRQDPYGNELRVTVIAVADELAAAAELVMGKTERCPAAIVRGYRFEAGDGSGRELLMPPERDLFR